MVTSFPLTLDVRPSGRLDTVALVALPPNVNITSAIARPSQTD